MKKKGSLRSTLFIVVPGLAKLPVFDATPQSAAFQTEWPGDSDGQNPAPLRVIETHPKRNT